MENDQSVVRVAWGVGTGVTPAASYDAALARANLHQYNLSHVSSVIPPDAHVEVVGTAPDLGPPGNRLVVVESRHTTDDGPACAGLGWVTSSGAGVFLEAAGSGGPAVVRDEIEQGLTECCTRREGVFDEPVTKVVSTVAEDGYGTAVVLAAYGRSRSLF